MSSCEKIKIRNRLNKNVKIHIIWWSYRKNKAKKTHQYYAQIQLGLLLCNLSMGILIVYEQINHSILQIEVEFDHEYCTNMYQTLICVYFNHYVPFLVRHHSPFYMNSGSSYICVHCTVFKRYLLIFFQKKGTK